MTEEKELQLPSSEDTLLPCGIVIDREGEWYYGGSLMHRKDIVAHLCQHMPPDSHLPNRGKTGCKLPCSKVYPGCYLTNCYRSSRALPKAEEEAKGKLPNCNDPQ